MRRYLPVLILAACSGSQDAPRPLADPPAIREADQSTWETKGDDDGDGVPNDADGCPLAAEKYSDPNRDGCPEDAPPDAGATKPFR